MAPRRRATVGGVPCTTNDRMTGGSCSGRVATLWSGEKRRREVLIIRRRSVQILEMNGESYRLRRRGYNPSSQVLSIPRRIDRTVNSLSSCSCNLATSD